MCECGCMSNATRYKFPGPGKVIYLLTLSPACKNCDAPSGVSVERITPDNIIYKSYARGEFTDGDLPFEKWADNDGVAIITGMRQHEFVAALQQHLTDLDDDMELDDIGAEVVLEEMYDDAQVCPQLVVPEREIA